MESSALTPAILQAISRDLNIAIRSLVSTIELLDEGGTVPFIARYRKEATGNLDEVQIRAIQEKAEYFRELETRKKTVLKTIEELGKLTPELRAKIEASLDKNEVEDLYLPYKPKRRTKAQMAREKGLEPLADYLWNQERRDLPLDRYAVNFLDPEKGVESIEQAIEGARHIVSERVSEAPELRKALRTQMLDEGVVASQAVDGAQDPEGKFKMYADYREPAAKIPSHRMLAIRRGAQEEILRFEIELPRDKPLAFLKARVHRTLGDWTPHLNLAIEDAYDRLLNPSIQTEIRLELKQRSDEEAIRVFRENLQNLLLAPPAGALGVIGIDPGIRTGCKVAVVDETGKLLDHTVIYPHEPKKDLAGSTRILLDLTKRHTVRAIAIGNGTASRETLAFVQDFLREQKLSTIFCVPVNESGASVYSASDIARREFPDLDLTVRGAISIARRLQDPLAELVKIDPKSIGVGQYQHDVDQKKLRTGLEATVESCVNRVGVDLNTASFALLRYVSGISERVAEKITEYRNEHGRFQSRMQLTAVPGFGPKTFEQAAGFLRIRDGEHPLDGTAVHPESYPVVEQIAKACGVTIAQLLSDRSLIENVKLEGFQTGSIGMFTLGDIREELRRPGRDPRDKFTAVQFREDVREMSDLQPGMKLDGVVTNVTRFGAFVDVGVHHDGLVHVSELSYRHIEDPGKFVRAGMAVKVQVVSVDLAAKRISLSMKALETPPVAARKAPPRTDMPAAARPLITEQLNTLAEKFRRR
ncbi:MAG TPA: Tex family protein [Bryobacteraceae bacterium]|nr:Tex family protein [Bryobacteraceae bacterium]